MEPVTNLSVTPKVINGKCTQLVNWTPTSAQAYSVLWNDKPYRDGSSGYQFFGSATGSVACEDAAINTLGGGTVVPNASFVVKVRAYYGDPNVATTPYADAQVTYTVPSDYSCSPAPAPTTTKKKGHG